MNCYAKLRNESRLIISTEAANSYSNAKYIANLQKNPATMQCAG